MRYTKKTDPNRSAPDNSQLVKMQVFLPPKFQALLKDWSRYQGMPMSRLICIAIDNELQTEKPFTYPTEFPDEEYQEYMYLQESEKVLDYIAKFPRGIGRDLLIMCRYEYGLSTATEVLRGIRELLEQGVVQEIQPTGTKFGFWHSDYRVLRAIDEVIKDKKPKKFKRVDGKSTHKQKRITNEEVD